MLKKSTPPDPEKTGPVLAQFYRGRRLLNFFILTTGFSVLMAAPGFAYFFHEQWGVETAAIVGFVVGLAFCFTQLFPGTNPVRVTVFQNGMAFGPFSFVPWERFLIHISNFPTVTLRMPMNRIEHRRLKNYRSSALYTYDGEEIKFAIAPEDSERAQFAVFVDAIKGVQPEHLTLEETKPDENAAAT